VHRKIAISFLTLFVVLAIITSCKSNSALHELKGQSGEPWYEPVPYGMAYVKEGSFLIGSGDQNPEQGIVYEKRVSVNSFWMDETEITNDEYRQYINWVADSVAASLTFQAGVDYYRASDKDNQLIEPASADRLKIHEIWSDDKEDVVDALKVLYYQDKERLMQKKEIDYRKIFYRYSIINLEKASRRSNSYNYKTQSYNGVSSRADFIETKMVPVYPDTLVWVRDFTYSYNEPWTLKYFYHEAFKEYPVVGVTWEQANAFCNWRTDQKKIFLDTHGILPIHAYRLPTEAEWEYGARGGRLGAKYPWGGYYTSTEKGCYVANFKPKRGNYVADSRYSTKSMKVGSFDPNDFGLFDMAGNVAEWTSTAFDVEGYAMMNDYNPQYQYNALPGDPPALKRKVVRGGSWKDIAHYIQVSTRDFEYQDTATSFIGFRCVMNAIEDEHKSY
jgi:gliding motility-associated lipoprotein GldK